MKIFLYILTIFLLTLFISAINYLLFCRDNKRKALIDSLKIFLLVNLCDLSMLNSFYGLKNLLNVSRVEYIYFLYYFLNGLIPGFIYLAIKYLANRFFNIEYRGLNKKASTIVMLIISGLVFFIGCLGFSGTRWEQEVYYNATPDQIFITMLTPITGTDSKLIFSFIEGPLFLSLALSVIMLYIAIPLIVNRFTLKDEIKHINEIVVRNVVIITSFILFISGLTFTFFGMQLEKIVIAYTIEDSFIEDNYVNPEDVKITLNGKRRNLVHIYLESIENSFFDYDNHGIMDENLMPDLFNLYSLGDNFSHREKGVYGGPLKTYGGSFSCASMVNQVFGIPMRVPSKPGQYAAMNKFLPGAVGIGDILHAAGYNQVFMHGADGKFAGLEYLYTYHGDFKIFDYTYAKREGLIPNDYRVNWGFEDEKLYSFAKDEMLRLSSLNEPFNVIIENADTHNPGFAFDGDKPIFGDSDIKEDYAKTIKFSQKNVYEFVRWIMDQDFYENTTIVIIGDHNSMEPSLFKGGRDKGYTRTTYNLILNSAVDAKPDRFNNRRWSNFDYMPTILASLGYEIEGNRLGLGTNLYSNLDTAFERFGYDEVNKKLVRNSKFYNEAFMKEKKFNSSNLIINE